MENYFDIIIVGAGTAGLSAAIYACRAGKSVLVLEQKIYGGQIVNALEVENYPGILKISGYDFVTHLYNQAKNFGAQIKLEKVNTIEIDNDNNLKTIVLSKTKYFCKAVIIATGAKNRPLGIANETELIGKGVSYCAICDGAFFRNKVVAVAGGGNTALQDALFLSNYCSKVYLIHRRNEFRGEKKLQNSLQQKTNVEFVLNKTVTKLIGTQKLSGIEVQDKNTNQITKIDVEALFVAIGQMPENEIFSNLISLDEKGYIIATENCKTNVDGIFVAGDCRTKQVRQLVTAASDGAVAALNALEYCASLQ